MCMCNIGQYIGLVLLFLIFFGVLGFYIKFYSDRLRMFDSKLIGFYEIPAGTSAEIVLRELISYISSNEINCFKKIYIKILTDDDQVLLICKKICDEYPVFDLINISKC